MKVLVLLEFGIPPYRDFLFRFLNQQKCISEFLVIHTGQKFDSWKYDYETRKVETLDFHLLSIHRDVLSTIERFDVIISSFNIYRPMCWLPMLWKKKRWILWGPGLGENRFNRLNKLIREPFIKRSEKFIVYTSSARDELVDNWGVDRSKLLVANNTLYISNAGYCDSSVRNYLLYVGRIQERKGILKALQALKRLKEVHEVKVPMVIVGDGNYKTVLETFVQENQLTELVTFKPGTFDDLLLKEYFCNALCYISPDHVGLGVVHAFSYGIPVLTSSQKEHAREFQYCSEENSILYSSDEELTKAIELVYKNPVISEQKGRAGHHFYTENLSYNRMNQVFLDALTCRSDP